MRRHQGEELMPLPDRIYGVKFPRAERLLRIEVQKLDLHPDMSHDIILRWTRPDQWYEQTATGHPLCVYLDTPATHKDQDRDEDVTFMLERMHFIVKRYMYKPPISMAYIKQIASEILRVVKG
jgi:hypothetical protein